MLKNEDSFAKSDAEIFRISGFSDFAKNEMFLAFSTFSFQKGLVLVKKKGYRGSRCEKRYLSKCADGVARTYTDIESRLADLLQKDESIKEFRCNVLLDGFSEGEYCSDFVCVKTDGDIMVRECVYRKMLIKPMTVRLLDASRLYWLKHGVSDWGIVIEKEQRK